MRRFQFVAVGAFALLSFMGGSLANAQEVTKARVPFPFVAGRYELPAGDYRVVPGSTDSDMLRIVSLDGLSGAFVMVRTGDASSSTGDASFEFTRIAGKNYLIRIDDGDGKACELILPSPVVAAERALHASNARTASHKG